MKNCLIMGSGRSGTSMVTGMLAGAGYYMGDTMLPPTPGNPKGYFESRETEAINERLIQNILVPPNWIKQKIARLWNQLPQQPNFSTLPFKANYRWLAHIPPEHTVTASPDIAKSIEHLVAKTPFCFKDPRFCYTLPAWQPYLENTVFICVFRHPVATVNSILKEVSTGTYLPGLDMSFNQAMELWTLVYRHVLEKHRRSGDWLFLHYAQILTPEGQDHIAQFTGANIDQHFPDQNLQRSTPTGHLPINAKQIYQELCNLAGYRR
jgi:hypothetical protein